MRTELTPSHFTPFVITVQIESKEDGIEFPQLIGCEKIYRLVMERVDHPRKEKSVK